MSKIELITFIKAPIETVFNNCRNIDLHIKSTQQTNEKVIAGTTSGLIEKGETVTWQGKHFGLQLQHQSLISELIFPFYFEDVQIKGHFKWFKHQHFFEQNEDYNIMKDVLEYEIPFAIIGKLMDYFFIKRHLTNFILERNSYLKKFSENQDSVIH